MHYILVSTTAVINNVKKLITILPGPAASCFKNNTTEDHLSLLYTQVFINFKNTKLRCNTIYYINGIYLAFNTNNQGWFPPCRPKKKPQIDNHNIVHIPNRKIN